MDPTWGKYWLEQDHSEDGVTERYDAGGLVHGPTLVTNETEQPIAVMRSPEQALTPEQWAALGDDNDEEMSD